MGNTSEVKQCRFVGTRYDIEEKVQDWAKDNPNCRITSQSVHDNVMGDPLMVTVNVKYIEEEPSSPNLPFTATFSERTFYRLEDSINDWLAGNPDVEIQHMSTVHDGTFYRSILIVRKKI